MASSTDLEDGKQRKSFGLDLTPLRASRDFRAIFVAGLVGTIGGQGTYVVVAYQMKVLTNSFLDVALLGAAELAPLIVFGLLGGTLADAVDKRRMILVTELAMLLGTIALMCNALLGHPETWVLFATAAVFAAADSLQRPSLDSIVPRVVPHDQLTAAASLSTFRWTFGSILGPIVGGTVVVAIGAGDWFAADAATFFVTLACFARLASSPPTGATERVSLAHVLEGLRYAGSRKDLLGSYLIDISAMLFAFPVALFPFLAGRFHFHFALGLLYAGLPAGALLATLTSRWTLRVHRYGRAIVVAAVLWGFAVAVFGLTDTLPLALGALVIAGAADAVSGIFRSSMWNSSIPDGVRGRMAGIELLSYSTGPELGQLRSALVASATSLRTSVLTGGLACAGACACLAMALPSLWRFDARSDEHVTRVREERVGATGTELPPDLEGDLDFGEPTPRAL